MTLRRSALASFAAALVTIAGVVLIAFLALRAVPGDPAELILGDSAMAADREALRARLGLDQPLPTQLVRFAADLARGNLGESLARKKPVLELVAQSLPNTFLLAMAAMVFANLLGIPLGLLAAYRPRGRLARAIFFGCVLMASLPSFWLGPLLVLALALQWPWLPVASFHEWSGLVLPTVTMGIGLAAQLTQTTRAAVAECLGSDYIRTAYAKGAGPARVLFRHALPAAAIPIVTVSALQLGHLLAGAVIIETIFSWPGLGKLTYDAILQRDYPTVQASVLVIAITYVALNALTDTLNGWLDPEAGNAG